MAHYEVDCPACPSTATVTLGDDVAIYRIEAFDSEPRDLPLVSPSPAAMLGEKLYLDRDNRRRRTATCGNGHHLRVLAAEYVMVPRSNCLYEPAAVPAVECPHCAFRYGTHGEFVHEADTDRPASTHVLRAVTTEPEPAHDEVPAITRQVCVDHDRLTVPRSCPHCGRRTYFNYRTLDIDPTVHFLDIENA
jgi:hypothetical protein